MNHNGREIIVRPLPFPQEVTGAVREEPGRYIVFINCKAPAIVQRQALGHELAHICLDHFTTDAPIRQKEREAEKNKWKYYRIFRDQLEGRQWKPFTAEPAQASL